MTQVHTARHGGSDPAPKPWLPRIVDPARFAEQPELMILQSKQRSLAMPAAAVAHIQLEALRHRFALLRDRLPALAMLAAENGIDGIASIEDGARLLFKHSVYKSYPVALIEQNRFGKLTQWLGKLTTADLSNVRTDGLKSIDDWLDAVERDAGVRIVHTTGTSGKLSFLPRGTMEREHLLRTFIMVMEEEGRASDFDAMPMIVVGHRTMYNAYGARLDSLVRELYDGDESMLVTLDPGRLSADVLSLGGRLSAVGGNVGRVSPALIARRDRFVEEQKRAPERRAAFFDTVLDRLRGRRVMMTGNWSMYHEMLEAGRARGLDGVFSGESRIVVAGGTKGKIFPDGFKAEIARFLGVDGFYEGYGMSELSGLMPKCRAGHYHAMPWIIVYVLDPVTGEPCPREGTHTGRFGAIDLMPRSYWGGVLSGDEVTMTFGRCACGHDGPYVAEGIRRYSEREGGDDKITCAGAPEAHDNALAYIAALD